MCPAMCVMIGGGIWITNRIFGKKRQANHQQNSKEDVNDIIKEQGKIENGPFLKLPAKLSKINKKFRFKS